MGRDTVVGSTGAGYHADPLSEARQLNPGTLGSRRRIDWHLVGMGIVLGAGLIPRLVAILSPIETLIRIVPDDAFYYLATARHIVAGDGSTFDGMHSTNGYHPLWMALLLPLAAVVDDRVLLLRAVLAAGVALSCATALLLDSVLRRLLPATRNMALPAVAVYFVADQAVASSLNGLETSMATFLFTILLRICILESSTHPLRAVMTGGCMGLMFLARTDTVVWLLAFALISVLTTGKPAPRKYWGAAVAVSATLAAPWLLWSILQHGSIVQTSGLATSFVFHQNFRLDGHGLDDFAGMAGRLLWGHLRGPARLDIVGAIATTLLWLLLARRSRPEDGLRRALHAAVILWGGALVIISVHTALRWYPRPWYFDQILVVRALSLALCLASLFRLVENRWKLPRVEALITGAIALLALTLNLRSALTVVTVGDYPQQIEMLDAAIWLRSHTDPTDVIGAFNAGVYGYFSERVVIGLDGVINSDAYALLRERRLADILWADDVQYVLDYDPVMWETYRRFLGPSMRLLRLEPVVEVRRLNTGWLGNRLRIYRVLRLGTAPRRPG